MKKIIVALAAVGVLFIGGAFAQWHLTRPVREFERTAREMVGRPETEVLQRLGPPAHVVSSVTLEGRTVDYPWRAMKYVPVPTHPVRNKVLLYPKLNMAIYIYIDERGTVEHVAVAWT